MSASEGWSLSTWLVLGLGALEVTGAAVGVAQVEPGGGEVRRGLHGGLQLRHGGGVVLGLVEQGAEVVARLGEVRAQRGGLLEALQGLGPLP